MSPPSWSAAIVLALLAAPVGAEPGATGGETLGRPIGSRALALGEAFTGVEGELDSASYNPAGVSRLRQPNLQLQYTNGIADDKFSAASYGHPFRHGAVWAGLAYYDAGTVNLQFADGTTSRVAAQQDFVGALGAALSFAHGLSAGAAARLYRFALAEQAAAQGVAADFGAQARLPIDGLSIGASIRNVGPAVKYEQEGDPLPLETRAGVAYLLDLYKLDLIRQTDGMMSQFLFSLDGVQPRDDQAWGALGVEMRMPIGAGAAAVRLGYKLNRPLDAPSIGIGLRERRITLDYAFGARKDVNSTHHVTLGWFF